MKLAIISSLMAAALLGGCGARPAPEDTEQATVSEPPALAPSVVPVATPHPPASDGAVTLAPHPPLIGAAIALAEWKRAANRETCAALALAGDGGAGGEPRPANFGGGWGVAFDLPDVRSAYGVASTGTTGDDEPGDEAQRRRLTEQWPYFRDLGQLPQPSFAGYGVSGAERYPDANPQGEGLHSLAYVRVGGQSCTYNVWSRISRAHLETLLDNLRLASPG